MYCVKTAFCCLRVKLENKEYHHGGFQQQSPQCLVDRNEHIDSRNDLWRMRLKLIQEEYYFIGNQKS